MKDQFFVMLNCMNGGILPMVNNNEQPALYWTEEEARADAEKNPLAQSFGFEIFRRGDGL
jgi:hypothetical protein